MSLHLIDQVNAWLTSFADVLTRWEKTLRIAERGYLDGQLALIMEQLEVGELIQAEIAEHKVAREKILTDARSCGYTARHIRAFAEQLGAECPIGWIPKITELELQLNRVQQLSTSLWMSALRSQSTVTEMLLILATGKSDSATYHPNETHSIEGGFLVNEAA
ncbi:MAG: hypothetical protein MUC43_05235 [Pirellula sp.]|jgi:hypothetical protein|nr:hypothetical protein [Pirellula sp.]